MKESYLYEKLKDRKVQCKTCEHRCLISAEKFGICGVRQNIDGKLYALNYGKAVSLSIDPIEKKPFFHFLPGTHSLSIATVGCNLRCENCQNWQISQLVKKDRGMLEIGQNASAENIVEKALQSRCPSISYTYTEPTIFLEYALDTMRTAKKERLKNAWVTNGYMSDEALKMVSPYLDAANVDLKSFSDEFYRKRCGAKLERIIKNLRKIKKLGIWLEITTLIIPSLSDDSRMLKELAKFIFSELGSDTPWHVSAFSAEISWKLGDLPDSSIKTVKKAYEIGHKAGLKYVYTGNIPSDSNEDTYCPNCSESVIKRAGYFVERLDDNGKCPKCHHKINIIL